MSTKKKNTTGSEELTKVMNDLQKRVKNRKNALKKIHKSISENKALKKTN